MSLGDDAVVNTVSTGADAELAAVLLAVALPVAPMSYAVAVVVIMPIEMLLAMAIALPPVLPFGPLNESADAVADIEWPVDSVPVAVAIAIAAPGLLPDPL
jgi:hypothetical protein